MEYSMSVEDNIFYAKRNIVDSIYKEIRLEGIGATFADTKAVYEGGEVSGLAVKDIVTINNLKHAWEFIFANLNAPVDIRFIRQLHNIIAATLTITPGEFRTVGVDIGGTNWKPALPEADSINEILSVLSNEPASYDSILKTFARICRGQWFYDCNKRTAQLVANKELIRNGLGIFVIPEDQIQTWEQKLIDYYVSNNEKAFVEYLRGVSIFGLELSKEAEEKETPPEIIEKPFPVVEPGKAMTPAEDRAGGIRSAEAQKLHAIASQDARSIGSLEPDTDHKIPK